MTSDDARVGRARLDDETPHDLEQPETHPDPFFVSRTHERFFYEGLQRIGDRRAAFERDDVLGGVEREVSAKHGALDERAAFVRRERRERRLERRAQRRVPLGGVASLRRKKIEPVANARDELAHVDDCEA